MVLLGVFFVVTAICASWYWLSLRQVRRKAAQVLLWIEAVVSGQGHVICMRRVDSFRFKAPVRLACGVFQRVWFMVEFSSCRTPFHWLWNRLTKKQDLVIFQADLDAPPTFFLDVQSFTWFAQSRRSTPENAGWTTQHIQPFIISTRMDWRREITSAMTSLVNTKDSRFLNISFSRYSPHFSVTMPLDAISPYCPSSKMLLETVREVAASSSPSVH